MPFAFQQHANPGDRPNRPPCWQSPSFLSRTSGYRPAWSRPNVLGSTPLPSHHMLACVRGPACTTTLRDIIDSPPSPCVATPVAHSVSQLFPSKSFRTTLSSIVFRPADASASRSHLPAILSRWVSDNVHSRDIAAQYPAVQTMAAITWL